MNFLKDILKGVVIGIANAIPGVSGGTMMVSMGVYDKFISAITNLFSDFKKSVKTLFPYAIGMVIGIIGLSFIIEYLFETFPLQTALLFIGLILGGLPLIFGKFRNGAKEIKMQHVAVFFLFFAFIFLLQWLDSKTGTDVVLVLSVSMVIRLFIVGVVAAATMVVPGVSGSMILMLLGFYTPVIELVTSTIKALIALDFGTVFEKCLIIIPFALGVAIGTFFIAKLIEYLLKNQEQLTYSAILGLIVASPFVILMQVGLKNVNVLMIIMSALTFLVGFVMAYFLGRE